MDKYFEILGLNTNATFEEVKKAYRDLSKKYHPDFYQNNPLADLAQEKFKEINEAYKKLKEYYENKSSEPITDFITKLSPEGKKIYFDKYTQSLVTGKILYPTMIGGIGVGEVKNGYEDGITTTYYKDGRKSSERTFINGVISGEYLSFNGESITCRESYLNGLKHGKEENYSSYDLKNYVLNSETEYKYGKEIGPFKTYDIRTNKIESVDEVKENFQILKMEDENIYYQNGLREGSANLYYDDGIEKVKYIKGKVFGFSTFYKKEGGIKKYYYKNGKLKKDGIIKELQKKTFSNIYNFKYKKENKEYIVGIKQEEYVFYKCLVKIYKLKQNWVQKFTENKSVYDLKNISYNFLNLYEDYFLSLADSLPLNEINISTAEANDVNIELQQELRPTSLEDFAEKIRKRDIIFKFDDFKQEINNSLYYTFELIDKIVQEIEELFLDEFYPHREYDIYQIPCVLEKEYWISVFKEANDRDEILDELIEILNVVLKDETEILNLLNIYIGIKYEMDSFVEEAIKNIEKEEKYENLKIIKEIITSIFKLEKVENLKEVIYMLKLINLPLSASENNLAKISEEYMILKNCIENVKNKNCIFNKFINKIDDLNQKQAVKEKIYIELKNKEIKKQEEEKRRLELQAKQEEERRRIELQNKSEIFNQNLENMIKYYNKGIFETKVYDIDSDLKNINILYDIFKDYSILEENGNDITLIRPKLEKLKLIVMENKKKYESDLEKSISEIEKAKKDLKETEDCIPIGLCVLGAIGGYFYSGILLGIGGAVVGLVLSPAIIKLMSVDSKEKIRILNLEKPKLEEIVRGYKRIIKIIKNLYF